MENKIRNILLIGGTLLFYALFFGQLMGLNTLLFSLFIISSSAYLFPKNIIRKSALIGAVGVLFASVTVLLHSSAMAIFVWVSSLILFIPMVHYRTIRSIHWAGITALIDYITVFDHLKIDTRNVGTNKSTGKKYRFWQTVKLAIIPIIVLVIFFALFREANPRFNTISSRIFESIGAFIEKYFRNISYRDFLFLLWAFITLAWMLIKKGKDYIAAKEADFKENIIRKRKKKTTANYIAKGNLKPKLKNEYRTGMMLMIMVNLLLVVVNIIDINWVWLNFEYEAGFDLAQFVHEGTYLLIFSILLSMGIMLYFFRKNLNFYHKKKNLQIAAYVWIVQNAVLVISVALRNYHYINHYGLAYKRIGVFFFLAAVLFGLISLIIKIQKSKSLYFLLKINSWAVSLGFLIFAVPDWDIIIAKNNITDDIKAETDLRFLMKLDEKAYPIIDANMHTLEESSSENFAYRWGYGTFKQAFYANTDKFMKEYPKRNITEFNFADQKSYRYFRDKYGEGSVSKKVLSKDELEEQSDAIYEY